ncbi:MAG: hypothetical protein ACI4NM_10500 [Bullifex sp.]
MKQRNKGLNSFLSSWIPKIISFIIALLIFIAVKYMNMASRVITIPLSVTLPDQSVVLPESLVPSRTDIIISGNDELIYLVDPTDISAHADFSAVREAGIARVPVTVKYNEDVFLDASLAVRAKPDTVRILFKDAQ